MRLATNPIEVAPKVNGQGHVDKARCLMFYDFDIPYSSQWLSLFENIFSALDIEPDSTVGVFGREKSKGKYRKVRQRLYTLFENVENENEIDIRIDSRKSASNENFFPSDVRIAFTTAISGIRHGVVAVRESVVSDLGQLVDRVANRVFSYTGPTYAHAFNFPAAFGPDYYLLAIGSIPKGYRTTQNYEYEDRLARWRDNTWHNNLHPNDGYMREVYPMNFLLPAHMAKSLNGQSLTDYAKRTGILTPIGRNQEMYRWDIKEEDLAVARQELELSGLILSSPHVAT